MRAAPIIWTMLLIGLLAADGSVATAQTVYRCGALGNQYSHQPCETGKPVDVADTRSAEQIAQSRKTAAEQQKLALQMARERREQQLAVRPAQAAGIAFVQPSSSSALAAAAPRKPSKSKRARTTKTSAPASQKEFMAIEPGSGKKKNKAKRASAV